MILQDLSQDPYSVPFYGVFSDKNVSKSRNKCDSRDPKYFTTKSVKTVTKRTKIPSHLKDCKNKMVKPLRKSTTKFRDVRTHKNKQVNQK